MLTPRARTARPRCGARCRRGTRAWWRSCSGAAPASSTRTRTDSACCTAPPARDTRWPVDTLKYFSVEYKIFSQAVVNIILTHAPWLANEQSWSGWSPLHSAAVMGHSQVVTTLLAFGANPRYGHH